MSTPTAAFQPAASGHSHDVFGRIAYGALFTVVLPLLMALWAARLDELFALPVPGSRLSGVLLAAAGLTLMVWSTVMLRLCAGGWPMSPYPPQRRVTSGPYALFDDPIYVGACIFALGIAIALASGSGVWIVTPVLALACFAFVLGYEAEATITHLGRRRGAPLIRLPADLDAPPELADRLSIHLLVFLPWLLAFEGVNLLGVAPDAMRLETRWDRALPLLGWTEPVYFLAYPFLLALPFVIRKSSELRRFAIHGWVATITLATIYLVVPTSVAAKPVPAGAPFETMLLWERAFDDDATGFPSFHVVWLLIAAVAYSRAFPRLRPLWWTVTFAVAISCVTTGMHVVADIAAAAIVAPIVIQAASIWRIGLSFAERIAASWCEWDWGWIRFLSHGVYAALGSFSGIVVIGTLAGERELLAGSFVAIGIIAGAGLWAQFLEGSPALLRPYGFYGGIIGGLVSIALLPLLGFSAWLMLGAYAVAAPLIQAWGRVRCLVQGCCHGRPCDRAVGMRFVHPRSRVTRLAGLADEPVHPTQVYSIVWSLFTFVLLLRLWMVSAPLSFIAGGFFILNGLGRFVEEHFRGEPQTRVYAGLHIYQWLAIACVVGGAVLTSVRTPAAPSAHLPGAATLLVAAAVGLVTYFAYGVDFPRLNTRFSRLV